MLILGVSKKGPQEGNVSPVPRFHFQYPPQLRQKAGAHKRAGLIYCLVTSHPPLGGWLVTKHPPSKRQNGVIPGRKLGYPGFQRLDPNWRLIVCTRSRNWLSHLGIDIPRWLGFEVPGGVKNRVSMQQLQQVSGWFRGRLEMARVFHAGWLCSSWSCTKNGAFPTG